MEIIVTKHLISPYGLCILLSYIFGLGVSALRLKKKNVTSNIIGYSILSVFFMSVYFAVVYTYIVSHKIGLSSMGALLGLIIGALIIGIIDRQNLSVIMKYYILSLPLFYSISKIGCHLAGCCHGYQYNGPFNIRYIGTFDYLPDCSVFPVQLTETIIFFIIFIVGLLIKSEYDTSIVIILCCISKFGLDYLRMSHVDQILSINQIICIIVFIFTIILTFRRKKT